MGCGYVEKAIRGNRYLYFWCFQARGGSVRKIEVYMGPAGSDEARHKTLERIEEYTARAHTEFESRRERWRRELS